MKKRALSTLEIGAGGILIMKKGRLLACRVTMRILGLKIDKTNGLVPKVLFPKPKIINLPAPEEMLSSYERAFVKTFFAF